jgi:hypothetical protein
MNNLIPWLPQYLQPAGSRAVTTPGTSAVPYIYDGEVQPPPRETFGKPSPRFGPTIEGEAIRPVSSAAAPSALDNVKALVSKRLLSLLGGRALGTLSAGAADAALGPMGAVIAAGDGRGTNSADDMKGLTDAYAAARRERLSHAYPAGQVTSSPLPPPVAPPASGPPISTSNYTPPPSIPTWASQGGVSQSGPFPQNGLPSWAQNQPVAPSAGFNPQPRPAAAAAVPMPQPRPASAPQPDPGMNFFQRNAAMMQDPMTGQFIDPTNAAVAKSQADQNGSALIKKMLSYVNNKADNAPTGNTGDASTYGG